MRSYNSLLQTEWNMTMMQDILYYGYHFGCRMNAFLAQGNSLIIRIRATALSFYTLCDAFRTVV